MKTRCFMLLVLLSAVFGVTGCADYYGGYPGYGPSYAGPGPYSGPGPYYGGGGGSVVVAVGDRPYYRGPGYWTGNRYYIWKPGHWVYRNGQKFWIRGHYVMRGY